MNTFLLSLHFTLVLSALCADSYADIDAHNIHDENRMFARMHSGRFFFHLHNCQIIHVFIITHKKNTITPSLLVYMYYPTKFAMYICCLQKTTVKLAFYLPN